MAESLAGARDWLYSPWGFVLAWIVLVLTTVAAVEVFGRAGGLYGLSYDPSAEEIGSNPWPAVWTALATTGLGSAALWRQRGGAAIDGKRVGLLLGAGLLSVFGRWILRVLVTDPWDLGTTTSAGTAEPMLRLSTTAYLAFLAVTVFLLVLGAALMEGQIGPWTAAVGIAAIGIAAIIRLPDGRPYFTLFVFVARDAAVPLLVAFAAARPLASAERLTTTGWGSGTRYYGGALALTLGTLQLLLVGHGLLDAVAG